VGPSGEQVGDVQYDGPANTAGNFRFSDSTDGSCSTLRADDANRFYAWLRASDEAAAASLCAAVAPGDLSGTAFQLRPVYATMPSDLWICGW